MGFKSFLSDLFFICYPPQDALDDAEPAVILVTSESHV